MDLPNEIILKMMSNDKLNFKWGCICHDWRKLFQSICPIKIKIATEPVNEIGEIITYYTRIKQFVEEHPDLKNLDPLRHIEWPKYTKNEYMTDYDTWKLFNLDYLIRETFYHTLTRNGEQRCIDFTLPQMSIDYMDNKLLVVDYAWDVIYIWNSDLKFITRMRFDKLPRGATYYIVNDIIIRIQFKNVLFIDLCHDYEKAYVVKDMKEIDVIDGKIIIYKK